jgi:hypothetical protein
MTSRRSTQFHTQRRNQNNNDCRFCKENGHTVNECTVLANTECKYCHDLGHTTRRCPKLVEKETRRRNKARTAFAAEHAPDADGFSKPKTTFRRRVRKGSSIMGTVTMGRFAVLNAQEEVDTNTDTPVLKGSWSKPLKVADDAAAAPKSTSQAGGQSTAPQPKKKSTARWADMADESDSDSDEEDIFFF